MEPTFNLKETREVKPAPVFNPNLPPSTEYIQLAPITLVPFLPIQSVVVLPSEVDIERMETAISALAGIWPDLAGRYVTHKTNEAQMTDLAIKVTSSVIPLEIGTVEVEGDYPFPTREVIQKTTAPYGAPLSPGFETPDSGATLTAMRLTQVLPSGYWVLGITISHLLVDAAMACKIVNHLSQLYVDPTSVIADPPTFFGKITYPAWPPTKATLKKHYTPLSNPVSFEEIGHSFTEGTAGTEMITITLTPAHIAAIKKEYSADKAGERLSHHDTLSGWWVHLLERAGEEPIRRLRYSINVSHDR